MPDTNNPNLADLRNSKQFQETVQIAVQKAVADYFEKQQKHKPCPWSRRREQKQQQNQPDMVNDGPDFGRYGQSPFWCHYMNHHHPHHHHYRPGCWNNYAYYKKPDNFNKFCEPGHLFDFTE